MSHDMLGNMNEYSSIDKSKEIHAYRTLEPANEIVDVKKVGGASPPSIPKEYEIPIPLADTGCELITDKVPTPTEMN